MDKVYRYPKFLVVYTVYCHSWSLVKNAFTLPTLFFIFHSQLCVFCGPIRQICLLHYYLNKTKHTELDYLHFMYKSKYENLTSPPFTKLFLLFLLPQLRYNTILLCVTYHKIYSSIRTSHHGCSDSVFIRFPARSGAQDHGGSAGAYPICHWEIAVYSLDEAPLYCRATYKQTTILTHIHT